MIDFQLAVLNVFAQVVNPGKGSKPPGSDNVEKVISWAAWLVFAACVVGVLFAAGQMAMANRQGYGGGGEHASRLGWVLGACIVAGSASALVGALV